MSTEYDNGGVTTNPGGVPRETVRKRSAFHKTLTFRDDVLATEYSGLGFRTLVVALGHERGLPEHVRQTAERLGYRTERVTQSVYRMEIDGGGSG